MRPVNTFVIINHMQIKQEKQFSKLFILLLGLLSFTHNQVNWSIGNKEAKRCSQDLAKRGVGCCKGGVVVGGLTPRAKFKSGLKDVIVNSKIQEMNLSYKFGKFTSLNLDHKER